MTGDEVSVGADVAVIMTGVKVANGKGVFGLTVQKISGVFVGGTSVPQRELQAVRMIKKNNTAVLRAIFIGMRLYLTTSDWFMNAVRTHYRVA